MSKGQKGSRGQTGSKKILVVLIVIVAGLIGTMTAISQTIGKKEVIPMIQTVVAEKGDIDEELDATGIVESQNKKTFFSPVNAKVKTVGMEVGDSVKAGTKLVTFDLKDLEKENQKAEWGVRSGDLDIQDAVNTANTAAYKQALAAGNVGPIQQEIADVKAYINYLKDEIADANKDAAKDAKDDAEDSFEKQKAALDKQYQAALKVYNTDYATYQSDLAVAKSEYENAVTTYNSKVTAYNIIYDKWRADSTTTSEATVNIASNEVSKAENSMNQKDTSYTEFLNNPPMPPALPDYSAINVQSDGGVADTSDLQTLLEDESAYLAELQGELSQQKAIADSDVAGVSDATLEKMDINTNLAELDAKTIEELIAEGRKGLLAEFNGVISACTVVEGSSAAQGMELFTLQSIEDVSVEITVSKNDYSKIKEGQSTIITMGDSIYNGTVEKVNRIATVNDKGAPVIGARIKINDADENIFLGVDAKVTVELNKAKDVVMVPLEAVNIGNSGSFCYVLEGGMIARRLVETGISSAEYIEITSGLEAGAEIITDLGDLIEGDKATAMPPSSVVVAEEEAQQ